MALRHILLDGHRRLCIDQLLAICAKLLFQDTFKPPVVAKYRATGELPQLIQMHPRFQA